MSKPALSSRLMGLKFMQRAQEKEKKVEAEEAAEERDVEAHWVVEGARTRCVVIAEGDPPCTSGATGRLSFCGFNEETEQLQMDEASKQRAAAAAAAEAAHPDGKVVSDEAMAASLQKQQRQQGGQQQHGKQHGKQHDKQRGQRDRHGSGGRHVGDGSGKKQRRGGDEDGDGDDQPRKQRARYF